MVGYYVETICLGFFFVHLDGKQGLQACNIVVKYANQSRRSILLNILPIRTMVDGDKMVGLCFESIFRGFGVLSGVQEGYFQIVGTRIVY